MFTMRSKLISIFYLITFVSGFNDYYWRDYTGKIPADAYSPGNDINLEPLYIGQGFLKTNPGFYPTTIHPGRTVILPMVGAKKADNFVQILCSPRQEYFKWIPSNKTQLHLLPGNVHLVRGGIEDGKWLNVGRVRYQGDVKVGKVLSGHIGNAVMWFVHDETESVVDTYEVLTYDGNSVNEIDVRTTAK